MKDDADQEYWRGSDIISERQYGSGGVGVSVVLSSPVPSFFDTQVNSSHSVIFIAF